MNHLDPSTLIETDAVSGAPGEAAEPGARRALTDFYRAFNSRDLVALESNWAPGDLPSMDNPIGGIRRGWSDIRSGYQRLFDGPARVQVEFYDYSAQIGADWALFVGRERGTCQLVTGNLELAIRTTRWFALLGGVWRQVHHHGSIESGALLAAYQRGIFGAPL